MLNYIAYLKLPNCMILLDRNRGKTSDDIIIALYGEVQKAVEVFRSHESRQHITIVIDDVSLMEVDAMGSSNLVLDFLRYCYSLTAQFVSTILCFANLSCFGCRICEEVLTLYCLNRAVHLLLLIMKMCIPLWINLICFYNWNTWQI